MNTFCYWLWYWNWKSNWNFKFGHILVTLKQSNMIWLYIVICFIQFASSLDYSEDYDVTARDFLLPEFGLLMKHRGQLRLTSKEYYVTLVVALPDKVPNITFPQGYLHVNCSSRIIHQHPLRRNIQQQACSLLKSRFSEVMNTLQASSNSKT